jgi:hypothetical protein
MAFWPRVMQVRRYTPPRDHLRLETDEPRVFELAEKLWEEGNDRGGHDQNEHDRGEHPRGCLEGELGFVIRDVPMPDAAFAQDAESFERSIRWTHEPDDYRCEIPGLLSVRIDIAHARVEASAPIHLLRNPRSLSPSSSSFFSSLFSRYLLEAPAAVLLGRRAWQVLHAGAVVGPKGAVVIRGGSGAGKSTLVAAAFRDGLSVLADETLLAAREDPDDLAAAVRDITLLPDAARLLGLSESTSRAFSGGEEKRRVDLFAASQPPDRRARRVATVLLGPRTPGPARLLRLAPAAFLAEFRRGEISEERPSGNPDVIARAWGEGFQLDGAEDLCGATQVLRSLVE